MPLDKNILRKPCRVDVLQVWRHRTSLAVLPGTCSTLASLIDAFSPDNAWRIWCLGNFLGQTSKSSPRLQMVCPCRQCIHQAGLFMTLRMWLFRIWTKLWNTWTTSFSLRRSVPCQDTEEPTIVVIFGHIYTEMCLDFPRHIKIGSFQRKNNSVSTRSVPGQYPPMSLYSTVPFLGPLFSGTIVTIVSIVSMTEVRSSYDLGVAKIANPLGGGSSSRSRRSSGSSGGGSGGSGGISSSSGSGSSSSSRQSHLRFQDVSNNCLSLMRLHPMAWWF